LKEKDILLQEPCEERSLSAMMQSFLIKENWSGIRISVDPDDPSISSCAINLSLLNQIFPTWFEIDEELSLFQIFVYSPILIPHHRFQETVELINLINIELRLGRLAVLPDPDDGRPSQVQFRIGIDVEGGNLSLKQMETMLEAATFAYERYQVPLAEIIASRHPALRIWKEFKKVPPLVC
jgi:hypothetical protein